MSYSSVQIIYMKIDNGFFVSLNQPKNTCTHIKKNANGNLLLLTVVVLHDVYRTCKTDERRKKNDEKRKKKKKKKSSVTHMEEERKNEKEGKKHLLSLFTRNKRQRLYIEHLTSNNC